MVDLACRRDPYALKPSANKELAIQGELNKNSSFVQAKTVPNFS
jgi:hypothetical protein